MPTTITPAQIVDAATKLSQARLIRFSEVDQDGVPTPRRPFLFAINPSKMRVKKPKVEKYELTKAGYDRQFWQNGLVTCTYNGSSGAFVPAPGQVVITTERSRPAFDVRGTARWRQFKRFERFYDESGPENVRLDVWAYDYLFVGSLDDFEFDVDAERPGHIAYSFKYTGLPRVPTYILTEQTAAASTNAIGAEIGAAAGATVGGTFGTGIIGV